MELTDFYGQFIISDSSMEAPDHFAIKKCNEWYVYHHSSLLIRPLILENGETWGWVLGYPIAGGIFLQGDDPLYIRPIPAEDRKSFAYHSTAGISGRYLVLADNATFRYRALIPDPFCSLSCVFDPKARLAASTTSLLRFSRDSYQPALESIDAHKTKTYYPFGATDDSSIKRLLPNHELSLENWDTRRFWPMSNLLPDDDSSSPDHVAAAFRSVTANIVAIGMAHNRVYSGLTAGRDSRVMLACTPPAIRDKTFYYTWQALPEERFHGNDCDIQTAKLLAKRHRLNHRVYPTQRPSEIERKIYSDSIGHPGNAVTNPSYYYRNFIEHAEISSAAAMFGFGGEVSVAYYLKEKDENSTPAAADILGRMVLPRATE
ncbi:MAG: hypothetical protein BECKG1743D_GA0114223_105201 [Candidatus Kentron sp. G]|nr:MAG: hypothetical protein BECKG1743F_GA0114225_102622 [Candidatus Kentron sp. G]VFN01702.1 MAG: hypothetical protein BECKG1743E_GA0114224_104362 [Candidatus Kentron sp. G]VFN03844.1 MAG: hypothetical protein BECKG1743D_GA0114223_105201 [Candidatus Kentron sp. G]